MSHECVFDAAHGGSMTALQLTDGSLVPLSAHRWHADAESQDHWLLNRCHDAAIDLGCGPGRLVRALRRRGLRALGIDTSPRAIEVCRANGIPALRRDIFSPLPDEGGWQHALLADGNVGIGGNPVSLLRRTRGILGPGGTVLVELAEPGTAKRTRTARLTDGDQHGPWFPWSVVSADAIPMLATYAGLRVTDLTRQGQRWFAELVPGDDRAG